MGNITILGPYEKLAGQRAAIACLGFVARLYDERYNHGFSSAEHFAEHAVTAIEAIDRTEAWLYDTKAGKVIGGVVYTVAEDLHHAGPFASEITTRLLPEYNNSRNVALVGIARRKVIKAIGCDKFQFSRPQPNGTVVLVTRDCEGYFNGRS